jgi:hypothetical protein
LKFKKVHLMHREREKIENENQYNKEITMKQEIK